MTVGLLAFFVPKFHFGTPDPREIAFRADSIPTSLRPVAHVRSLCLSLLALSLFFASPSEARADESSLGTKQQLQPGKNPGTFAYSYTGAVTFSQEPAFPVTVIISDYAHQKVASQPVTDSNSFTIQADLAPGGYWIQSCVAPDKAKVYWDAYLVRLFISPSGEAAVQVEPGSHQKMMTVLSPDPKGTAIAVEKRPVLAWQPLPGTAKYQVNWFIEPAPNEVEGRGEGTTTNTEFALTEDTVPNRRYEWSVWASGPDGNPIGYWSAAYFFTPGGKETFAKLPDVPARPAKGSPYLGLAPDKLIGTTELSHGISVRSVGTGSPALKAGIEPNDLLTSFDGVSLDQVSERGFVELVRAKKVGDTVTIDLVRNGLKKSVTVTIGAMP